MGGFGSGSRLALWPPGRGIASGGEDGRVVERGSAGVDVVMRSS